MRWLLMGLLAVVFVPAKIAQAAAWKPNNPVEIVVPNAPGGGNDAVGRLLQRIWQEKKLVPQSIVMNRSGGGGNIAYAFLNQHPRDPHYVLMLAPTMFTNRITGSSTAQLADYTPLAMLFNENIFISVKADSPIRSLADLVAMARATAPYGGVYSSHIRDEADYTIGVVAAVQEVIDDGVNGLLVDFFDEPALAARVAQALHEPGLYRAVRTRARDTICQHYSLAAGTAGYTRLLTST